MCYESGVLGLVVAVSYVYDEVWRIRVSTLKAAVESFANVMQLVSDED